MKKKMRKLPLALTRLRFTRGLTFFIFVFSLGLATKGWTESRSDLHSNKTEAKHVLVASDDWPPLLTEGAHARDAPIGFIADFFKAANAIQNSIVFDVVVMPFKRIQREVAHGNVDVVAMKNIAWMGDLALTSSEPVIHSGDVYIALAESGRTQTFFQEKSERQWVGVNGYHYGFANFNSDAEYLRKKFNIQLVTNNFSVIRMILKGRAEVGVVPETVLTHFMETKGIKQDAFLIGKAYDSEYTLSHLVRKNGPISVDQMNDIIRQLRVSGELNALVDKITLKPR